MASPPISEDDLHAWTDGRLEAERRAEVEAWLAAHPDKAQTLNHWRELNAALHSAYDPVAEEAIPARLREAVRRPRRSLAMAAAVGWIAFGSLLGIATGYQLGRHPDDAPTQLVRNAAIAHAVFSPEQRHAVEVGADQEQHLVAWLSKRLGRTLHIPALDRHGYQLMGGRLLSADAGPSAQFMYENDAGERLTLYVSVDPDRRDDTAFRFAEHDDIGTFYWIDGGLAYALSGRMSRQALLPAATDVYRQLLR
ncbi:anti-sigma factor [Azoarcus sp. L1K30]|uniref:anti-sigma factor family protein n=1 Tax=Azoarcus sp. L1K30 TaxID=2820277 RepID=UPI001B81E617|nr:anti-sigma factor [Azoarcus sp. L1K30]MBR0568516.1 anti-sigma factor [Azoarcus sp. L1K30]